MDRFGDYWVGHWEKLERNWRESVGEDDLVLLPGDHSWALKLEQAVPDLEFIQALPGRKVLIRGNHDYWWSGVNKLRQRFPGLHFLQNDAIRLGPASICGCRGWDLPGPEGFSDPQEQSIYLRELERFKLALAALDPQAEVRIAMLHYPPLFGYRRNSDFTRLMEEAQVDICVFGHLHGSPEISPGRSQAVLQGPVGNIEYYLVSCDMVDFRPVPIPLRRLRPCNPVVV